MSKVKATRSFVAPDSLAASESFAATAAPSVAQTIALLERSAATLRDHCASVHFGAPVAFTYNPLDYAWQAHRAYLRMAQPAPRVLFVGMNPGPFGMAQTGVPFGEVAAVKDFLGIDERAARIGAPAHMHAKRPVLGFACQRSEVSGSRVWSWACERFGTRAKFFQHAFIWNWCPLAFMSKSGANLTPDKLPRGGRNAKMARELCAACDEALAAAITALQPANVVGFGAFAAKRAQLVMNAMRAAVEADAIAAQAKPKPKPNLKTNRQFLSALPNALQVLHPSPASPAANRGWAAQIDRALAHVWAR